MSEEKPNRPGKKLTNADLGAQFQKTMNDFFLRRLFRDFMLKELSEENLFFWLDAEEYKTITDQDKRKKKSDELYAKYLKDGSDHQINVGAKLVKEIEAELGSPTENTYKAAQQDIFKLMALDCYPRFLKDKTYLDYKAQRQTWRPKSNKEQVMEKPITLRDELNDVMSEDFLCSLFRNYLEKQKQEALIDFAVAVEKFKKTAVGAKDIFDKYIAPGSLPLTVDTAALQSKVDSGASDMFNEAQEQVINNLLTNGFSDFKNSDFYTNYMTEKKKKLKKTMEKERPATGGTRPRRRSYSLR